MPHANAPLTERGRLRLARCVVEDGWPLRRAAERFQVSVPTATRWAGRYREHGPAGMVDRSSRPRRCPHQTPRRTVKKIKHLRLGKGLGPAQIGPRLGLAPSTVGAVIRREGWGRLADADLASRAQLRRTARRYEHPAPGDLVHVDIKKLGRVPLGGGHRAHGRGQVARNKALSRRTGLAGGYSYVHNAVDDHSRLAYSEVLTNEQGATAAGFWQRAQAFYESHGITVTRVLTDNGSCYRSRDFAAALASGQITHKRTRPYRPQTNGKVERFNRTLLTGWAYSRIYRSERTRLGALSSWLHFYNHHRPHSALNGLPPITRVTNVPACDT